MNFVLVIFDKLILVIGFVCFGKSEWVESLVSNFRKKIIYVVIF